MVEDPTTVGDGRVSDGHESKVEDFQFIEEQDTILLAAAPPPRQQRGVDPHYNVNWVLNF